MKCNGIRENFDHAHQTPDFAALHPGYITVRCKKTQRPSDETSHSTRLPNDGNADLYLQHKINGYTSFNARQKETIHREVSDYMHWHRKIALPEYTIFLQKLNGVAQSDGPSEVKEVSQLRAQLVGLYRRTLG